MSRRFKFVLFFVGMSISSAVGAAPVTFTGIGTLGGNPVDAKAVVTLGTGTVQVVLTNLQSNPTTVAQNVSDFLITLDGTGIGSLSSVSGLPRNVASGGAYTDGTAGTISGANWKVDGSTAPTYHITDLVGGQPKYTIIGPPGGVKYAAANSSIAGNGPHNNFLAGPVTFNLTIAGVTPTTKIKSFTFSFGTSDGSDLGGKPSFGSVVPLPSSLLMGVVALVGVGGWRSLARWRAARR